MSHNPFHADAAVRDRIAKLTVERGDAVHAALREALGAPNGRHAENAGGVIDGDVAREIAGRNDISPDELMLLALDVARAFAHPPISDFYVGAVGREAGSGNLVLGGNLEFPGTHIGNTVHGEGFVFCRAFSRGTAIETLAIGEAHPCAHCRQFLSEFAATASLTLIDPLGHRLTMSQLYPWPFDPAYLGARGVVPGEVRQPELTLAADAGAGLDPGLTARLVEAGRRAYVPYGKSPAALVLTTHGGASFAGAAIESVAFNPTLSPFQTAMIDLAAHGYAASDIAAATIATAPAAAVDYVRQTAAGLAAAAPAVELRTLAWA